MVPAISGTAGFNVAAVAVAVVAAGVCSLCIAQTHSSRNCHLTWPLGFGFLMKICPSQNGALHLSNLFVYANSMNLERNRYLGVEGCSNQVDDTGGGKGHFTAVPRKLTKSK